MIKNIGGAGNNKLVLALVGKESNRSAIGADVLVQVGLEFAQAEVSGGNGQNQNSLPLEFGVGAATVVDSVRIIWPSGITQEILKLPANKTLVIQEK